MNDKDRYLLGAIEWYETLGMLSPGQMREIQSRIMEHLDCKQRYEAGERAREVYKSYIAVDFSDERLKIKSNSDDHFGF